MQGLHRGMPVTYQSDYQVSTLEPVGWELLTTGSPSSRRSSRTAAAFVPMKMMGRWRLLWD
jgi:hypothetical protein